MLKKPRKETIAAHLDVDWLAGKRSDPRFQLPMGRPKGSILGMGFLITTVACAMLLWSPLSRRWLTDQWNLHLRSLDTSPDEALAIMLSLNALEPKNYQATLQQLVDENQERRRSAFHSLRQSITGMAQSANQDNGFLVDFVSELSTHNAPYEDLVVHKANLASDILAVANRQDPRYLKLEQDCQLMIRAAETPLLAQTNDLPILPTNTTLSTQSKVGANNVSFKTPTQEVASTRDIPPPVGISDTRHSTTISIADRVPDGVATPAKTVDEMPLRLITSATETGTSLTGAKTRRKSNPTRVSLSDAPMLPSESNTQSRSNEHRLNEAENVDNLKNTPDEDLFPLLGSTQERRVRLVSDELSQRGITHSMLDMAIEMARGDATKQLTAMDKLIRVNGNPTPILMWMAKSKDRDVRKRAIAILGSMQDREALHRLRQLATREPDEYLRQLIEQAVASNNGMKR